MSMIDTTKPMQLTDGTPVTYVRTDIDGDIIVTFLGSGGGRHFNHVTGRHVFGKKWVLQNVPSKIDWTKPIRTVEGNPATLVATAENGDRIVEVKDMWVSGGTKLLRVTADGLARGPRRVSSHGTAVVRPDDILNVPVVETIEFVNVYADGSIGTTIHKTESAARYGSKYGKTRVAILKRTKRDGNLVSAEAIPTEPQLRDRYTDAHNPFAGQ